MFAFGLLVNSFVTRSQATGNGHCAFVSPPSKEYLKNVSEDQSIQVKTPSLCMLRKITLARVHSAQS